MSNRVSFLVAVVAVLAATPAAGYIHFPPATLPKMCRQSTAIRVLSVTKFDKEKGVVVYEVVETIKGEKPKAATVRHAIRRDAVGVKPVLDWLAVGKTAVVFTIEGGNIACGYVFIDDYCYSVDHNRPGDFWLMLLAEPNLSATYHGPAEKLRGLAKDLLAGKDVTVPTKPRAAPETEADRKKRADAVNDVMKPNRGIK